MLSYGVAAKQVFWLFLGEGIMSRDIKIQLIDKIGVVKQRVNKAIAEQVNAILTKKRQNLSSKLRAMVRRWVSMQPEMLALQTGGTGSLPSQLGLRSGTESIITNKIIDSIARSTHVDFQRVSNDLKKGGLILKCIQRPDPSSSAVLSAAVCI